MITDIEHHNKQSRSTTKHLRRSSRWGNECYGAITSRDREKTM